MTPDQVREIAKCYRSPAYFVDKYCRIYDPGSRGWVRFRLWVAQRRTLSTIFNNRLVVILKARQLGLTWLCLAFALWLMLFRPAATILFMSRRETESIDLLDKRLKGMFRCLPDFLKSGITFLEDNTKSWTLSNGSRCLAFPTTAGDSYSATMVLLDEADLIPDLNGVMGAMKPTIDAGGRMILLSRSDKKHPESPFKRIYRAAKEKLTEWVAVFLPWYARPDRDEKWYQAVKAEIEERTGALDELYEQYPATDTEALAAATLDKRFAPKWLEQCYQESRGIVAEGAPAIPGLVVHKEPEAGHRYVIGADTAEGNPTSDDSAVTVLDLENGAEVASLSGKLQPSVLGACIDQIGTWYNAAPALVERNNHGHAVIMWLKANSKLRLLPGHDNKAGWHTTEQGKALMYDTAADAFRNGETVIHTAKAMYQLQSIDGNTLAAPEGLMDDVATSFVLALVGLIKARPLAGPLMY